MTVVGGRGWPQTRLPDRLPFCDIHGELYALYQLNPPTTLEGGNYGLILQLRKLKLRELQSLVEVSKQRVVHPLEGLGGLEETKEPINWLWEQSGA